MVCVIYYVMDLDVVNVDFYKFIMVTVELGVYIIHLYDAMNFF